MDGFLRIIKFPSPMILINIWMGVVGWCKVSVSFTSHDQGGVTSDCISMAKTVDKL